MSLHLFLVRQSLQPPASTQVSGLCPLSLLSADNVSSPSPPWCGDLNYSGIERLGEATGGEDSNQLERSPLSNNTGLIKITMTLLSPYNINKKQLCLSSDRFSKYIDLLT